jgi:hypothetical protein
MGSTLESLPIHDFAARVEAKVLAGRTKVDAHRAQAGKLNPLNLDPRSTSSKSSCRWKPTSLGQQQLRSSQRELP